MLSIPDMAILGTFALLVFGPDQLPRVARKAGNVMREIQNTSQSFIREMERAADLHEAEEARAKAAADEAKALDDAPAAAFPELELPPPEADADEPQRDMRSDAEHVAVAEKLAEPRPALDRSGAAEPAPEIEHPMHL